MDQHFTGVLRGVARRSIWPPAPFDIRGVVSPAPYAFLPKVTGTPSQHGHPNSRLTSNRRTRRSNT